MRSAMRRALLYTGGAGIVGVLSWAGFVRKADPDVGQLLAATNMELRFAFAIPATDPDGKPLSEREHMLEEAEQSIATVERLEPGMAVNREFAGFALRLRGRFREAAQAYREAQGCHDCTEDQRTTLVFNEARMLAAAGDHAAALAVLAAARLPSDLEPQRHLEAAASLRALGRKDEARARVQAVLAGSPEAKELWIDAGLELEQLGDRDAALAAFAHCGEDASADYHIARLQLAAGNVDLSLQHLTRANTAAPADVRRLLRTDAASWAGVATDARFQALGNPPAAPGR